MTKVFLAEINVCIQLNDGDTGSAHSSNSSTFDEHNYVINKAIAQNKGPHKLEKASEMSPGNPARMMSNKESQNKTHEQEKKSSSTTKLYKT